MKRTDFARDSIVVEVQIGQGLAGRPIGDRSPDWSSGILAASGVGEATVPELSRLAAGRQIGYSVAGASDAAVLASTTSKRDLADALRLMVAGVTSPRIDPVALSRFRGGYSASIRTILAQPQSVFQAMGSAALYGGDRRFQSLPTPPEVAGTSVEALHAHWASALGEGPIRIAVVGDFDRAATIRAVAASFGALPPRQARPVDPATRIVLPLKTDAPTILTHKGDPDQALVAVAWRTFGALDDLKAARAMAVATTVLQNRLNEEFRETEGGTYSPFVTVGALRGFDAFGQVVVGAQLTPARIADFYTTLDRIVADLATSGPGDDAVVRARETVVGAAQRTFSSNVYWSNLLASDLDDPRQRESVRTYVTGRRAVTAGDVRDVIRRYLADAKRLRIEVLPERPGAAAAK